MTNNLRGIRKGLCAFAKKCKGFKYTDSALITFLITGAVSISSNLFSAEKDGNIENQKQILSTDIKDFNVLIKEARKENNKLLKNTNLELVKLMEQGDHVVKSPWSSWQFGANYMYDNWGFAYKGRGDKKANEILTRDKSATLNRFLETSADSTSYGTTNLRLVKEPSVEIKISAGVRPKNINKQAPSYRPNAPTVSLPVFEPKLLSAPGKPSAPVEVTPTTFDPPDINFKGKGFFQHAHIDISRGNGLSYGPSQGQWKGIIIQNYDNYNTVDKNNDTVEGIINIEVGNLADGKKAKWWGSNLDGTANSNIQLKVHTDVPKTAAGGFNFYGPGDFYLDDGSTTVPLYTFINELRDHNATISGNYIMTNKGGENDTSRNVIFLSHNPAGPGTPGYDGKNTAGPRTATFNGTLTLNGTATPFTGATASSDVTIGVEHQLYSNGHQRAYSIFDNKGTIDLASGNNLVGILLDVEVWGDNTNNNIANNTNRLPHKTVNNGKIIINSQNSIGIDYGEYYNRFFKSDLTVVDIIVNGSHNYGLRMANIFSGNAGYFDKGTTIKSGGADKKILVQGTENVGVSIAKFLSSAKDPNPIANITGLNVEVAGQKNIGFLRHKTYANNTGDMILDANTMGTFTFGNGAKDSTLIRTDKYGIQVKKDITATGKDDDGNDFTGEGNTVLHSNGQAQHIYNYNTITVGKGFTKTVGMAATGTATSAIDNIVNEGTIDLQGKQSIGMYTDKFSQGKNTGSIKLSGVGDTDPSGNVGDAENVGISNKGKFEFLGDLEVNGKKSSGIYNTGTATIEAGSNPTDKTNIKATNGATGLYSKGTGSTITSNARDKLNITVEAGTTKEGLAVYAENQAQITLHDANITVNGGSAGAAAYDTGTKIDLTGATLKYDGNGYAAYSDGQGEIDLSNSNIELRGRSTLMNVDFSTPHRPITTSSTNVTVYSNDVVGINLNNLGTQNVSNLSAIKSSLGVVLNPGTEAGQTFNKFKELAIDNGTINFDVATDKNEADTNPGGFFFKKVVGQRLKLNVNENLTARLSSAIANEFYGGQVVGLEANSSKKATSNTETQVNIASGKVVDVARTDGTDKGGVGVFVNYGQVNNSGTIKVEKDSDANSNAVGIYVVNGSEATNNGSVNVSGEQSIGLLGMAYRVDTSGNLVVDEFGTGAIGQGKVNIVNKGSVDLDGQGAVGMFAKNNKAGTTFTNATALNDTTGAITTTGTKSVGMAGEKANIINRGTINVNAEKGTGMFAESASRIENSGTINIVAASSATEPNIGIFTEDQDTEIYNNKDIIGGNNTYGIYGKTINMGINGKVKVGENSVAIYSNGQYTSSATPNITLASGSSIEVGNNQSVGVFVTGQNQNISSQADMRIGDDSFGYVIKGTGTKLIVNAANPTTVGNDTTFIYSTDTTGNIENRTRLISTGNSNYGIYAAGNVTNLADMDFSSGIGNVAMYSIAGGKIVNGSTLVNPVIKVGSSDKSNKLYGIGMVAGYTDDKGNVIQTGTVENYGTIKVDKTDSIGMYATGSGSKAINRGTIELSGKNTTGMYLDNNAVGENYGTIKTVPNLTNTGIVGVAALNGAVIKNYGSIIIDGANNTGIYLARGRREGVDPTVINGAVAVQTKKQSDTTKKVEGIEIKVKPDEPVAVTRQGNLVTPTFVDTTVATPTASKVTVGATELDLTASELGDIPSIGMASDLGMYVDTSGVNYTNPIQGLQYLTGVNKVNLIFGTEASRYTTSKDIKVGENILKPYNDEITSLLSGGNEKKFNIASSSLTWIATGTQNSDDTFNVVYLSKIPYTAFAADKNTYNFMDGLEQRYGVEGVNSREKALFDKLNAIGKGEPILFAQATDEMMGHQYANVQQRINETGNTLDKEFKYLKNEWRNPSKDNNKIKVFGMKNEYRTDTAGVIDYTSNAYGVAYVHENEAIKLGNSSGWYAGVVTNRFKFKDIGKSKENQTMIKAGIFKTMSPMTDHNGSLRWTVAGDVFVGRNEMKRKFLVVDEVFNAKSDYTSYGVALKTDLRYDIRMSERTHLRPYGSLKLEYGRFNDIKEEDGEIRLEVEGNDYFSVKPEVGVEFKYVQPLAVKTQLSVGLSAAYENELGRLQTGNRARVGYTSADWYNLEKEKEDRRGNGKFDLNIGIDNTRFGVTLNAGYDTKGHNVRGGIGFRAIY